MNPDLELLIVRSKIRSLRREKINSALCDLQTNINHSSEYHKLQSIMKAQIVQLELLQSIVDSVDE